VTSIPTQNIVACDISRRQTRLHFSLVTTCRNEIDSLPRWKQDILGQTRQPDEIVIVDAFSDDGTAEMLLEWARHDGRVVVIQEKGNAAHGRNFAIERARHEHILSTDMGVRLCPVWCEELIKPFEDDPEVEVVAGSVLLDTETITTAAARAEYYQDHNAHIRTRERCRIANNSSAYTRRVWRALHGLPEDLSFYADDSVFGRQILARGYTVAVAPAAIVFWARPSRLRDFWKEAYNYGRGDGEANIKTPYVFTLHKRGFVPHRFVAVLHGLRLLHKSLCKPKVFFAMLRRCDLAAIALLPILMFGKGYAFASGYLVGDAFGSTHCHACRARLRREHA